MDGREGMPSFYLNRGFRGSGSNAGSGNQVGGFHLPPPGFKTQSNPNLAPHGHGNMGVGVAPPMGLPFHMEHNPSPNFPHGINMGGGGGGGNGGGGNDDVGGGGGGGGGNDDVSGGGGVSIPNPGSGSESVVKKKRGRPRKYAPDGSHMALGLTPVSPGAGMGTAASHDRSSPPPQKKRGRPRGSGRKQRLANVGEWMHNSAGSAFTPHIIHISVGEGRFEILCLSGSYLLAESGNPRNRTGSLSISACNADGQVIGGAIGGKLIASSLVQVVVCSFVYGGGDNSKAKTATEPVSGDEKSPGVQLN
ncbi:AT hook, DNA-binding motif-containing protein [Cynara cardunculus var. scolymus]|uniref:AT-hook motif nuclear-localized protein n=1 Tax=Cynara cardunculus var. scolymus TaxID=59895 RepID=A0A103XJL4_CYNCS|nr:AT hook, DNA-binding motif-containing protein [Cynara cardunculus var. scolymus]